MNETQHAYLHDDALMRGFCAGDIQCFQALYDKHEKSLYLYLKRIFNNTALADEVFQDVWERMIDARDQWKARQDASFKTWLFSIAHHRAIDVLRQSGREVSTDASDHEAEDDAWQHWPAPTAQQPEQQAFWRKAGKQLLHCLEELPTDQRAAFLLHHEDELSLDEMTNVLQAEYETVKSRLRYALSKIKRCMGAYMPPILQMDAE